MQTEPVSVELRGVGRNYGQFVALHDINLAIEAGQFVSLLGPSGCGKTTTLRLIAGFDSPTRGKIIIGDRDVTALPPNRRNLGMVFQSYALFPHMTVAENIGFGLRMAGVSKSEIETRVQRMLDKIHLEKYAQRMPSQLSGGQQQRVAIARSLIGEPSVLLLDEPMAALDKNLRHAMQAELRMMQQEFGITTVLVTHDQDEALTMSDTVVVMSAGHIRQSGSPKDIYERPSSRFVANFLGISNDLPVTVGHGALGAEAALHLPGMAAPVVVPCPVPAPAGPAILSIRPERVALSAAPLEGMVSLSGKITGHVFRGSLHEYTFQVAPEAPPILVIEQARGRDSDPGWRIGDKATANWSPQAQNILDPNS